MQQTLDFVELYISPLIIGVGLIFFFYGVVNYFVIGVNHEEERREMGRQSLLRSVFLFILGLLVFFTAHWITDFTKKLHEVGGVDSSRSVDILPIPNAPGVE